MTTTAHSLAGTVAVEQSAVDRVPWTVWTSAIATISVVTGAVWDISWHISVGRDTFWTPPHMLIQLCAAIGGLTSLYLILRTTFTRDETVRANSVRLFGLRAPLGAFLCGWGALTMLASAPFDNWWHETYGLDVKVLSPPHAVLGIGAVAVIFGGFLLIMAPLNRASAALAGRLETVFMVLIGFILLSAQADLIECSNRALMHSSIFYRCFMFPFPVYLMIVRSVVKRRWACTTTAAVYMALSMAQEWVLPLFYAEQKLGPVYQRVPYMVPLGFPVLIIVPALLVDLLWAKLKDWNGWKKGITLGASIFVAFVAAQWLFANFLMSSWSANWVFGTHYQLYMAPPGSPGMTPEFFDYEKSRAELALGMGIALITAMFTSRVGLTVGTWLRRVQR
ncbi:MAG TPA: hypothetical protein VHA33_00220 [Candidatus Angelobacter sp.]|nr:hypothetical protein [Candidatus Angelobacter sp.]